MVEPSEGLDLSDADEVREYSDDENRRITLNLGALLGAIHRGEFPDGPLSGEMLSELHRRIFDGVRDHAGKIRTRDFGSERLTFGPYRSSDRRAVPDELSVLFGRYDRIARGLLKDQETPGFVRDAIDMAVTLHAKIIRIHPFEDGNGRSARAMMSVILVRFGLRPIPLEAPRAEYIECLDHFFSTNDAKPLIDLCLRLYPTPTTSTP